MPDESEVQGLLALMLLHDSRRNARRVNGELVLLADQDHALWDPALIEEGKATLDKAIALQGSGERRSGRYVIQAAVAALHAEDTPDWRQIAVLYGELLRLTGSPVVELNRAVAVAEAAGPEAGLALVDTLDLDGYRYLHSTRADLLRRLGRAEEARREYERALALTDGEPERRFLERRLSELP
jgi:RNA polymerase sigma-70 factor (ECF subfamily)